MLLSCMFGMDLIAAMKSLNLPESFPCKFCTFNIFLYIQILSLLIKSLKPESRNLSSSELTGEIPSHISNLTMIEKLYVLALIYDTSFPDLYLM